MEQSQSKPIQKSLRLTKSEYYETHLSIVNCFLPQKLTPMEITVLSRFMSLEGDIAAYRFGVGGKKIVKTELKLSSAALSNHMRALVDKKFLVKTGDLVTILPILFPQSGEQTYFFKLINVG